MIVTDCHVHIERLEDFNASALGLLRRNRAAFHQIERFMKSPGDFLRYLDDCGVDRAVLINYVAPDVIGLTAGVNDYVSEYCKADPKRLIPCGGADPRHTPDFAAELERILRLGLRLIKIHPPHQLLYPNEYLHGMKELALLYKRAEEHGIPIMFHTGTSVFPGARNKYADPIHVDDVAVDFPRLKIILAHGGRPLWMETAFFLVRRHPNVYMDISGVPPKALLNYFPRIQEIAPKVLFGTDWPGPGVPDIGANLRDFRSLPLSEVARRAMLSENALAIWPE